MKRLALNPSITADGQVELAWASETNLAWVAVLVMRTGAVPAYTAFHLDGSTRRFGFSSLSRHQRYRMAIIGQKEGGDLANSCWWALTPRAGTKAQKENHHPTDGHDTAQIESLLLMPQEDRLTLWWSLGPGFADRMKLELRQEGRLVLYRELEPELTSLAIDLAPDMNFVAEKDLELSLASSFCGMQATEIQKIRCRLAAQGAERQANRHLPQDRLVYATLSLEPEISIFEEDVADKPQVTQRQLICGRCGKTLTWQSYRLRCVNCNAEFIPNGRGDYLDVDRLRFGTCRCCRPAKILIQPRSSGHLACAHSHKEHIRLPGLSDYLLAEDLPYGLCQCCRPRKPLVKKGKQIRCSGSDEIHRQKQGRWVLIPSQTVFDAAAIDSLLDAGMAEICATGVNRTETATKRKKGRRS